MFLEGPVRYGSLPPQQPDQDIIPGWLQWEATLPVLPGEDDTASTVGYPVSETGLDDILMDQIQTAEPEATSEVPEADVSPTIKAATCSLCFKEPSNEQIAEQLISSSFGKSVLSVPGSALMIACCTCKNLMHACCAVEKNFLDGWSSVDDLIENDREYVCAMCEYQVAWGKL